MLSLSAEQPLEPASTSAPTDEAKERSSKSSQGSQSAAFPRLFAKEAKPISVAPSCWPESRIGYLTAAAVERVQVGNPPPWRSAHEAIGWAQRGRRGAAGRNCREHSLAWQKRSGSHCAIVAAMSWLANQCLARQRGFSGIRSKRGHGHAPCPLSPHSATQFLEQRHQ